MTVKLSSHSTSISNNDRLFQNIQFHMLFWYFLENYKRLSGQSDITYLLIRVVHICNIVLIIRMVRWNTLIIRLSMELKSSLDFSWFLLTKIQYYFLEETWILLEFANKKLDAFRKNLTRIQLAPIRFEVIDI